MNKKNDGMKISSSCFSRMFIRAQKFDSGMWKQKRTEKEHKHAQHTDKTHLYIAVSSDTQTSIEKVMSIHRRKTKCGLSLLTVLHAYFANRIKLHVPRESWEQKIHSPNESNSALPKVDTQRDNSQKKNVAKLNGKITVLMHPTSQLTVGNVKSNNAPTMRRMPCTAHTHTDRNREVQLASERERNSNVLPNAPILQIVCTIFDFSFLLGHSYRMFICFSGICFFSFVGYSSLPFSTRRKWKYDRMENC